jgi:hypothetical protein
VITAVPARTKPPSPDPCLVYSRRSRFHGGTVIALDVHELADHEQRLRRPDGYRPPACLRCGGGRLHVHDRLQRLLLGEPALGRIQILRYICAAAACGATWRVLPAFVARHLWRRWTTVARTIAGDPRSSTSVPVPDRTRRRWNARLGSAARQLVHVLAHHDDEEVASFARFAGFDATRRDLVELFTAGRVLGVHALADIASTLHALEPGIRLM